MMQTRRGVVVSILGTIALAGAASAEDLPKAAVIEGKPPILDFGDGLRVPCSRDAFLTLWESSTFWLTFGFGTAALPELARSHAVHRAEAIMRYLLLTLAFAPQRLVQVDAHGWRQKENKLENFVIGELDLPGRASRAQDDVFLGHGNVDLGGFWDETSLGPMGSSPQSGQGGDTMVPTGILPSMKPTEVNAFCTYIVKKSDLSLDDVRKHATVLRL